MIKKRPPIKSRVSALERGIGAWYRLVENCRKEVLRILNEHHVASVDIDISGCYFIISITQKCELLSVSLDERGQVKIRYNGEYSEGTIDFDDIAQDAITLSDFMHELYRIEECWENEENEK